MKFTVVFISIPLLWLIFGCDKNMNPPVITEPEEIPVLDSLVNIGSPTKILDTGADVDWSPDGSLLAYWRNFNIFIVQENGLNPKQLTNDTSWSWRPSFSPDGNRIAFSSNRGDTGNFKIFLVDTNGTNLNKQIGRAHV
jgi:hypothetical protein